MASIIYRVQVGAYSEKKNATKTLESVKKKGFKDAVIVTDGKLYKVQLGAYTIKKNAEQKVKEVKSAGFEAIIKEVKNKSAEPKTHVIVTDHQKESEKATPLVYNKIIDVGCKHKGGAFSLEDIIKLRVTTCATAGSVVLQQARVLPVGKKICHTKAVGGSNANQIKKKNTLKKAMTGYSNLDLTRCKIVKCMKVFSKLSAECRQPGVVYIQDSNVCTVGGKDSKGWYIYSCNNSGRQLKNGRYVKNKMRSGYCFKRPILFAVVPLNGVKSTVTVSE